MLWENSLCGRFRVSENGDVYNPKTDHYLRSNLTKNGYLRYGSYGSEHRLVYEAFIGKIPEGMQINHLDGNKQNNHISNLEICTPSDNLLHAYRTGLATPSRGEKQGSSKLEENDIIKIYDLIMKGYTNNQISQIFNVYSGHISSIRTGIRWKHIFEREGMSVYKSIGNIPHTFPECVYIYKKCKETTIPQVKLGKELGIDPSTVSRIRTGKLWTKIEDYM